MKDTIVENGSKGIVAMILAMFGFIMSAITEVILALVVLMILDYLTGMIASYQEKDWESNIAIKGVIKKVGYIFLMLITVLFDYVLLNVGEVLGITFSFIGLFTFLVACWLISTELISIAENLGRMGVPIPSFLKKAFKKLKDTSEVIGEKEVGEEDTGA